MARGNRTNESDTIEQTPETVEVDARDVTATIPATKDTDRGNIGIVSVEADTEDWGSTRTRASNNPIAIAVRNAVKGTGYGIAVDNDEVKIERVRRMLRAAAQREDVGMNIHPVLSPIEDGNTVPDGNGGTKPARVKVRFKTGDRDKRAAKVNANGTTDGVETAQDSPSE